MTTYQWLSVKAVLLVAIIAAVPAVLVWGLMLMGLPVVLTMKSYVGALLVIGVLSFRVTRG